MFLQCMHDLRMNAPFWTRGNFELTPIFGKDLLGWGNHNEFAVCMSALGGAIDAACAARPDVRSGAAEGRQRQPDGLAAPAVSARLVRRELIPGKARRRASGISSLGGARLD